MPTEGVESLIAFSERVPQPPIGCSNRERWGTLGGLGRPPPARPRSDIVDLLRLYDLNVHRRRLRRMLAEHADDEVCRTRSIPLNSWRWRSGRPGRGGPRIRRSARSVPRPRGARSRRADLVRAGPRAGGRTLGRLGFGTSSRCTFTCGRAGRGWLREELDRALDLATPGPTRSVALLAAARAARQVGDLDRSERMLAEIEARAARSLEPHRCWPCGPPADQQRFAEARAGCSRCRTTLRGGPDEIGRSRQSRAGWPSPGRGSQPVGLSTAGRRHPTSRGHSRLDATSQELQQPCRGEASVGGSGRRGPGGLAGDPDQRCDSAAALAGGELPQPRSHPV